MKQTVKPVALGIIGAGRMGVLYGQIANELALTQLIALASEHAGTTAAAAQSLDVPGYDGCRYAEMLAGPKPAAGPGQRTTAAWSPASRY